MKLRWKFNNQRSKQLQIEKLWEGAVFYDNRQIFGQDINQLLTAVDSNEFYLMQKRIFSYLKQPLVDILSSRTSNKYSPPSHIQIASFSERLIKYFYTGNSKCFTGTMYATKVIDMIDRFGIPFVDRRWIDFNRLYFNYGQACVLQKALPNYKVIPKDKADFESAANKIIADMQKLTNGFTIESMQFKNILNKLLNLSLAELEYNIHDRKPLLGLNKGPNNFVFQEETCLKSFLKFMEVQEVLWLVAFPSIL